MKRFLFIDRLKGFTILVVVYAHLYLFCMNSSDNAFFSCAAAFEMYLFMFLSGYVAYIDKKALTYRDIKKKLTRRFISYILPAYMLTLLIMALKDFIMQYDGIDWAGKAFTGYWYLKCLAMFCIVQLLFYKCRNIYLELLTCLAAYVLFIMGWKTIPTLNSVLSLEHAVSFFPSFVLGMYFRKYGIFQYIRKYNWIYSACLIGFTILILGAITPPNYVIDNLSWHFIRPVCAIVVLSYLFMLREQKNTILDRALEFFGKNSLDVYMWHGVLLLDFKFMDLTWLEAWNKETGNPYITFLIVCLLALATATTSVIMGKIVRKSIFLNKLIYGKFK